MERRRADLKVLDIREAKRELQESGRWKYLEGPVKTQQPEALEVTVTFPAIREGDIPALVTATTQALTLGQAQGVTGIDQKAGILHLMTLLGIDKAEEIVEEMFPEADYDPDRTEELAAEKDRTLNPPPPPTAVPGAPGAAPGAKPKTMEAAFSRLAEALEKWKAA